MVLHPENITPTYSLIPGNPQTDCGSPIRIRRNRTRRSNTAAASANLKYTYTLTPLPGPPPPPPAGPFQFALDDAFVYFPDTNVAGNTVCVSKKGYRYGFNGMEKVNEIAGEGNDYDFGARMYDGRLGRWLSVDPLYRDFPNISPYLISYNCPIVFVDNLGEKGTIYIQVMLDDKGVPVIDKVTMDKVISDLNATYSALGVDINVEVHYTNELMSKSEFYGRLNADPTDSYVLIGNTEQVKEADIKNKNNGWEEVGIGNQADTKNAESAPNDYLSYLNADQLKQKGANDNYVSTVQKISKIIQHETGHPKFKGHPRNYNGKVYTNVATGHVFNTIMAPNPNQNVHDYYMVNELRKIHGTTKDARPIDEDTFENRFENGMKNGADQTLYLQPTAGPTR